MQIQNDDAIGAREKNECSKTQKKRACFWTRETQNSELRTLQVREYSFEHDYYVLSSELRQNKLAETNDSLKFALKTKKNFSQNCLANLFKSIFVERFCFDN